MTRLSLLLLGSAFLLPLAACSSDHTSSESNSPPTATSDMSLEGRAADILSRMTLEEKVGQIIQADIASVTPEEVREYNLGSVLNGGNSAPGGGKVADPEDWVALADAFWINSTDTSDGGVGIPAIWGTDAVHGHNNLAEATMFPHNIGLGAANDPELMRDIGDVTAREIRATGIDWTFAPTLAVARDDRWGRTYESYSENPAIVASFAAPLLEGLQGRLGDDDFLIGENVMATAKHFIADGGTQNGIDKGDTIGDEAEILRIHGAGYGPAIDAGAQAVMASFSSVNGEKMHGSTRMLNDVLRGQLNFTGFVVGDWNGHGEVPGCINTDCPESLLAGVDMYMAPESWRGLYASLLEDAQTGQLPLERLDEAVTRILIAKLRSGLFEAGLPSDRAASDVSRLGSDDHREVARRAVRQSLVLLKHENDVLPLKPEANILITGSGADSMQQQTGGWTLNWQGTGNANDEFKTGETIASGLTEAIEDIGGTSVLSQDGSFDARPDVAVVVFGEQPYAEFFGDVSDLVYEFDEGDDLALIQELKAQGIPVVSVFLSGRPLYTNPHINASDAFVAAWLPGTEGGGVADILVSNIDSQPRHDFTGRLSFSWPIDGAARPINAPDDLGVLFPFGYGLSYGEDGSVATLPENAGVMDTSQMFDGAILSRGNLASGFQLYVGDSSNLNIPVDGLAGDSLGGIVSVRGTDYNAQEDSRQITWSGQGRGLVRIDADRPLKLSNRGYNSMRIVWRADALPGDALSLEAGCGDGCSASMMVSDILESDSGSEWVETTLPLACLVQNGLDLDSVDTAFRLVTDGPAEISLHSVSLVEDEGTVSCPVSD